MSMYTQLLAAALTEVSPDGSTTEAEAIAELSRCRNRLGDYGSRDGTDWAERGGRRRAVLRHRPHRGRAPVRRQMRRVGFRKSSKRQGAASSAISKPVELRPERSILRLSPARGADRSQSGPCSVGAGRLIRALLEPCSK